MGCNRPMRVLRLRRSLLPLALAAGACGLACAEEPVVQVHERAPAAARPGLLGVYHSTRRPSRQTGALVAGEVAELKSCPFDPRVAELPPGGGLLLRLESPVPLDLVMQLDTSQGGRLLGTPEDNDDEELLFRRGLGYFYENAEITRGVKAGKVTPGLPPYVRDPRDRALLLSRHAAWVEQLQACYQWVCGNGGLGLMAHSYAPRSVDVEVDDQIVQSLRRAYQPEVEPTWPLRPEVDLIARDDQGVVRAAPLVERLQRAFEADGFEVKLSATYPLHPSTLGYANIVKHEPRVACVEVRRDLLVREFTPLRQLEPDQQKVARVAGSLCRAVRGALAEPGR